MMALRFVFALLVSVCLSGFTKAEDPTMYFNATDNDAYLDWLQGANYERSIFLPSPAGPLKGAAIHWNITEDKIYLAVAARATGWVGFGIAESGGMKGADAVIYMAADDALIDAHVLDDRFPVPDECQSWTLHNSKTGDGFLIFEASRLLDTGDTQDHPIVNDGFPATPPSRVIAAWSDSDNLNYHGPNDRVRSTLRFYSGASDMDTFEEAMKQAEGTVDLGASNYTVKPIDTEYAYFCFSYDDLVNMGMPNNTALHVIGIEPIVDPRSAKHVHHYVLLGSEEDVSAEDDCQNERLFNYIFVWAPGDGPLTLPDNVGGPLGLNGFKSFQLEIHYNNPWLEEGTLDSSGVRLYYTSELREHEFGVLQLGDPFVGLGGQPVGDEYVRHTFDCASSCSELSLSQNITVVREALHMHQTGESMSNYHIRNGDVIRVGDVQYFDFSQQGIYAVQQEPFEIQPGDSFRTVCQYKSNNTVFGPSSQQEMCIVFIVYYPRQKRAIAPGIELAYTCGFGIDEFLPGCGSPWEQTDLDSESEFGRTFGNPLDSCSVVSSTSGASVGYSLKAFAAVLSVIAALYAF